MKLVGLINRNMAKVVADQGHQDLLMLVDAGFAIPLGVETIDISLSENNPMVVDVLTELRKFRSVEKMILTKQTKETNPTLLNKISTVWGILNPELNTLSDKEAGLLSPAVSEYCENLEFD